MTPEIDGAFHRIKLEHGADSLDRVEAMLYSGRSARSPRQPLQEGAKWILPGLTQRPWHDPYEYPEIEPVVRALEQRHPRIKEELELAWTGKTGAFSDYEHYLMVQHDWQALYLYKDGGLVGSSAETVPVTHGVVRDLIVEPGRICPLLQSHFSTLLPGASIKPHCDLWNFSINLHFAVDIPEDCGISVAGEARSWQEGRCLLFDYSFEHEAWNNGSRPRTCLLVDLWHPETTAAEREALVVAITEIRRLIGE
jgi:hypothetical protein